MADFTVSVVIPAYNEEGNVRILAEKLSAILRQYNDYEVIFVDDGSRDGTLHALRQLQAATPQIKYVSFARNFGHQNALKAGLDSATGDCVISMDADMQHPPEIIPTLIDKWQEGNDIVYTVRNDDPNLSLFKRATASSFYALMNLLSDIRIEKGSADFRLLDRTVLDVVKTLPETPLFMRGMVSWLGFRQCAVRYDPHERFWGKSKYSMTKMMLLALHGITSFSVKPLRLSTFLGITVSIAAFAYGFYALAMKILTDQTIPGWTSVLISVLAVSGVQLIMLGILGEYIGIIFMQTKGRPKYIVRESSMDSQRAEHARRVAST